MAILKGATPNQISRQDVLKVRRRVTLRENNGQVIVSKWPRQRGPAKSPLQRAWIDRFTCTAKAFSSPEPRTRDAAEHWAKTIDVKSASPIKGSGWFYRDVLVRAANNDLIQDNEEVRVKTPTFRLYRDAAQTIPSGQTITLQPNQFQWDNNSFWSPTLNPTRATFKAPGLYMVGFQISFGGGSNGARYASLRINGATTEDFAATFTTNSSGSDVNLVTLKYFHANDYVEVRASSALANNTARLLALWAVAITPEALIS